MDDRRTEGDMKRGVCLCFRLLLSLWLKGVLAGDWLVRLPADPICSVVGSTVVLPCSYDFPRSSSEGGASSKPSSREEEEYKVLSEMWCRGESRCITPRYVFHSAGIFPDVSYQGRVQYLGGPETKNCSLKISELQASDSGTYVFYTVTSHPTQKMPRQTGLMLLVADIPSAVAILPSPRNDIIEGGAFRMVCCSPANPEGNYSWYTSSGPAPVHYGQVWHMDKVRASDSGRYFCQLTTRLEELNSSLLDISVQFPPHHTAVSVCPAGELPQGGTVTLGCSSDANPPVHTYTWYQGTGCPDTAGSSLDQASAAPRGTGPEHTITHYSTQAAGKYCCLATNRHGSQIATVTLSGTTGGRRPGAAAGISILSAVAMVTIITFIIVFIIRKRRSTSSQSYALTETSPPQHNLLKHL